jgi:hypothetical protein
MSYNRLSGMEHLSWMFPVCPKVNIMRGSFGRDENILRAKKTLVSSQDVFYVMTRRKTP